MLFLTNFRVSRKFEDKCNYSKTVLLSILVKKELLLLKLNLDLILRFLIFIYLIYLGLIIINKRRLIINILIKIINNILNLIMILIIIINLIILKIMIIIFFIIKLKQMIILIIINFR